MPHSIIDSLASEISMQVDLLEEHGSFGVEITRSGTTYCVDGTYSVSSHYFTNHQYGPYADRSLVIDGAYIDIQDVHAYDSDGHDVPHGINVDDLEYRATALIPLGA